MVQWTPGTTHNAAVASDNLGSEQDFLAEFRRAGIAWVQYACAATAVLLALFLLVPALSNEYSSASATIRLAMLVLVLLLAAVLRWHPEVVLRNYVGVVGSAAAAVLVGVGVLIAWPSFQAVSPDFSPLPAMLFGLFLCYAFLRLPPRLVATICWAFSVSVLLAAPDGFAGAGQLRIVLYLGAVNVLGMILSRSTEARERELFYQRQRAERAQVELKDRALAAEEAHAEKTRLLAAVSHDLRQPITAASMHLSLLRSKLLKNDLAQAQRQIDHIGDSIGILGATLDHLLTAARYDSGNEPIRIEVVELGPLLEQLRQTFEAEAQEKGIELRVRVPSQRIVVTSDATALWRVLMNLVSNAIKFTQPEDRPGRGVVVRARLDDGTCRIDVADTGIGIEEQHLKAIWQPYFQVQNSERNRARGLGLGLFLVKRALDHLPGHQLTLRSTPGRGSRFSIRLPGSHLSDPRVVLREPAPIAADSLRMLQGAYVLVLEDDRDARRAIQELLDDWGVVHSSGATLEELLPEAESAGRSPDALITDFRLPGRLSGAACVQELRHRLGDDFPAIIITGESDLASVREVMPADAVLLPKPFDSSSLAVPLVSAVERARRAESL